MNAIKKNKQNSGYGYYPGSGHRILKNIKKIICLKGKIYISCSCTIYYVLCIVCCTFFSISLILSVRIVDTVRIRLPSYSTSKYFYIIFTDTYMTYSISLQQHHHQPNPT